MASTDAADEREMFDMEQENENADGVPAMIKKSAKAVTDPMMNGNGNTDVEGNKDIAHSPSDSMSSLDSVGHGNKGHGPGQRRMSNVSDEERDRARVYREGVMNKGRESRPLQPSKYRLLNSPAVDLAHIAKTSYGIAQSPPNTHVFGTSPTSYKVCASFSTSMRFV